MERINAVPPGMSLPQADADRADGGQHDHPPTKDPVCGMTVDPASSPRRATTAGQSYYFCSDSCMKKFAADPAKYLNSQPSKAPTVALNHSTAGDAKTDHAQRCGLIPARCIRKYGGLRQGRARSVGWRWSQLLRGKARAS